MASGTSDLQRDLGGAIMQSIMGALLTAGFATSVSKAIAAAPNKALITSSVENTLTKSFSSAESVAHQYPHYAGAITAAASSSFVSGSNWAYGAGAIAIVVGAGADLLHVPRQGGRAAAAGRVSGRGHRAAHDAGAEPRQPAAPHVRP